MTWKKLQNIRNVMAYVIKYCIKEKLIKHNPTLDIDYTSLPFVKEANRGGKIKKEAFPISKIPDIINWCKEELQLPRINPLHPYGIIIGVTIGDRYGELRALKWSCIDFLEQTLLINDQAVPTYTMNDDLTFEYNGHQLAGHIKGYEDPIPLPIPPVAVNALQKIKEMHLDEEFVFPENYFRHDTFNNKIKKMAADLGLDAKKYSSHSLRGDSSY